MHVYFSLTILRKAICNNKVWAVSYLCLYFLQLLRYKLECLSALFLLSLLTVRLCSTSAINALVWYFLLAGFLGHNTICCVLITVLYLKLFLSLLPSLWWCEIVEWLTFSCKSLVFHHILNLGDVITYFVSFKLSWEERKIFILMDCL